MKSLLRKILILITCAGVIASSTYLVRATNQYTDYQESYTEFELSDSQKLRLGDGWANSRAITVWNETLDVDLYDDLVDIQIIDSHMFIAGGEKGLLNFDISDITHPQLLERIEISGGVYGIEIRGMELFAATDDDGLSIYELTEDYNINLVGTFTNASTAWTLNASTTYLDLRRNLIVQDEIVILNNKDKGFSIVNISDTSNPEIIGIGYNGSGIVNDFFLQDDLLFVADYNDGLEIYNISDYSKPVQIGYFQDGTEEGAFDSKTMGVWVSEGLAYVTDGSDGLEILNVEDPKNPVQIGNVILTSYSGDFFTDIEFWGNHLFISTDFGKGSIFNMTTRENPERVGSYTIQYITQSGTEWPFVNCFYIISSELIITTNSHGILTLIDTGYDSDFDFISDYWETVNSISNPLDDPDEDGRSNLEEYIADTNPHLPDPEDPRKKLIATIYFTLGVSLAGLIGGVVITALLWRNREWQ